MSRCVQGALLALVMIAAILGVLLLAELRPPHPTCLWQVPKIFSCVLDAHDGLAGGLIGAGGTIFAGWLAWTAVREQIRVEKALSAEERARHLREQRAAMVREMEQMQRDQSHVRLLTAHFANATDTNLASFLAALQEAYRHGKLVLTGGTSRLSPEVDRCIAGLQSQSEIFQNTPNLSAGPREVLARGVMNRRRELDAINDRISAALLEDQNRLTDLDARIERLDSRRDAA